MKNLESIRRESFSQPPTSLGAIRKHKSKLLRHLSAVQRLFEQHPLHSTLHKDAVINLQYRKACREERKFWANQARLHWLQYADSNSKFFHLQVKVKWLKNNIVSIQDGNDTLTSPRDIQKFVVS